MLCNFNLILNRQSLISKLLSQFSSGQRIALYEVNQTATYRMMPIVTYKKIIMIANFIRIETEAGNVNYCAAL